MLNKFYYISFFIKRASASNKRNNNDNIKKENKQKLFPLKLRHFLSNESTKIRNKFREKTQE